MITKLSSRSLLLEQLESRCMLAAGVFEHSAPQNRVDDQSSVVARNEFSDLSRKDVQREGEKGRVDQGRDGHGHKQNGNRNSSQLVGDHQRRSHRGDLKDQSHHQQDRSRRHEFQTEQPIEMSQNVVVPSTQLLSLRTAESESVDLSKTSVARNATIQGSVSNETLDRSSLVRFPSASSETTTPSPSSRLVIQPPVDELSGPKAEATIDESSDSISSGRIYRSQEPVALRSESSDEVTPDIIPSANELVEQEKSIPEELIVPSSLVELGNASEQSAAETDQWELDSDILQSIRSVTQSESSDQSERFFGECRADQLNDPLDDLAGLIDPVEFWNELPSLMPELAPSVVDIVLDLSMGVHRTHGLLASSQDTNPSTALTTPDLRDEVLLAIASEMNESIERFEASVSPELSTLAYPGLAVVAAAVAIAGQRQNQRMEHTRRREAQR